MCLVRIIDCLITKLLGKFSIHGIMHNLGVVYSQYWLQLDANECFNKHLEVIKVAFCQPKKVGTNVWVLEVLCASSLDIQQSMLKLTSMKSNALAHMAKPIDLNPFTWFWPTFPTSREISHSFLECFKLVEIAIQVKVFGNVEDESCFNSLTFGKSNLLNWLTNNLGLLVKMSPKKFTPFTIFHM